jgi:hypothetical protein
MAEAESALTRHDLEAKIVKRCWEDEGFRKEFTADPAGSFVKYLEIPAASLPKIVVHEETAGSWQIVLPSRPANPGELSDQDLEKFAGGDIISVSISMRAIGSNLAFEGLASAVAVSAVSASAAAGVASVVSGVVSAAKGW